MDYKQPIKEISPERRLCLAIFLRAVVDWLKLTKQINSDHNRIHSKVRHRHMLAERREINEFFKSDWCKVCIGGDRNFEQMLKDIRNLDVVEVERQLSAVTG